MNPRTTEHPEHFPYLSRRTVRDCLHGDDLVEIVGRTLVAHAAGTTTLPPEAYLGWRTPAGHGARLLAMPGAVEADGRVVVGMKTINASLGNVDRGMTRSQGFVLLLDPETARPRALLEAGLISAFRTAAVTVVAARALARDDLSEVALIGCGALADAHVQLLLSQLPQVRRVTLFDHVPARAQTFARTLRDADPSVRVEVADSAESCCRTAGLVVLLTTTTEGYVRTAWLAPGAVVCHVSLDDLLPEVVHAAARVYVDDWSLVADDERRLFGRMCRAGTLVGPGGTRGAGVAAVDGTLGGVLSGSCGARAHEDELVVVNPFGMAVLDVAVADHVAQVATARGVDVRIEL